jgi:CRISPR/Cas system-associated exonuclease Cas4 (RecB family)
MRMTKLQGKLGARSKARQSAGVILPAVKEGMLKDYGIDTSRRWDIVHPSELSHQDKFCPRAVYLRIIGGQAEPEKFDFVRENIFAEGNSIHSKWQARLRKYTSLWGDWRCLSCDYVVREQTDPAGTRCRECHADCWVYAEITLDAEEDALLVGHADGGFDNTMAEFKSVGAGTVRIEAPTLYKRHVLDGGVVDLNGLWKDISRPFGSHLNQGDVYLWIANHMGLPFTQMSYVYESKWNQQVKEFVIQYDEERSLRLIVQARNVMYAVQGRDEPECIKPGKCEMCKPFDARAASTPRRTVQVRRNLEEG